MHLFWEGIGPAYLVGLSLGVCFPSGTPQFYPLGAQLSPYPPGAKPRGQHPGWACHGNAVWVA